MSFKKAVKRVRDVRADIETVMRAGGWTSAALSGYARVDHEVARRGYAEAMWHACAQELPLRDARTAGQMVPPQPRRSKPVKAEVLAALADGITDLRDRAIVTMLTESGLRGSELVKLNRGMISLDSDGTGGHGGVPYSKSGGDRKFLFGRSAAEALAAYLNVEREDDSNEALFVDKHGNRITVHFLCRIIHGWCDRLGIEKLNLHQFRASLVNQFVKSGTSPFVIAKLLRHKIVLTTCRFLP